MKQETKSKNNDTLNNDLPKISTCNSQGTLKCNSPFKNNKIREKENCQENISPHKIKELVKLFKNSNSNSRILKISPYCNTILKNQLMNALGTYKLKERSSIKAKRIPTTIRWGNNTQSSNFMKNYGQNGTLESKLKQQLKEIKELEQSFFPSYIRKIIIEFTSSKKIEINVDNQVCEDSKYLSTNKIIQAIQSKIVYQKLNPNYRAIVGFQVKDFISNNKRATKIMERTNSVQVRELQQQQKDSGLKGCLQSCSYLLAIGKLNIESQIYSEFDKIVLTPILPKRIKEFLSSKLEKSTDTSMKDVQLKDFDIIKCLGSGGFSTVYLVRGNFNGKYYAMKVIDKNFIIESQRDGIVENERFILQTLSTQPKTSQANTKNQHSANFTTQLSFCFETVNHFIFILQYCPGGELFNQLKKVRKMTEEQARFYFLEILIALDYIHSHNILYRDLKPQNLLIDAQGHIKIADFGLSKPLDNSKSFSYSFCGSPEYMAPQMLTKSGHNFLLDYYCLGALLYELVIGVPPYYSLKQEEIYESILTQQLSFPNNVSLSPQIMNLLSGLLKKDIKQRLGSLYGIKQIMCHPWIGKIRRQTIQNRKLIPPFVPDLNANNFDADEIKVDLEEIKKKLKEDQQNIEFQTHFSNQFTFIHPEEKLQFLSRAQVIPKRKQSQANERAWKFNSLPSADRNSFQSPYSYRSLLKDKNIKRLNLNHNNSSKSVRKLKTLETTQRYKVGENIYLPKHDKGDKKIDRKVARPTFQLR